MQVCKKGKMFKVCEFTFIKNEFHEAHHPPMELIQVGPRCCDKCLTTCPKFSLKIEGFNLDFNIIALNFTNQSQTTPPVSKRTVTM